LGDLIKIREKRYPCWVKKARKSSDGGKRPVWGPYFIQNRKKEHGESGETGPDFLREISGPEGEFVGG